VGPARETKFTSKSAPSVSETTLTFLALNFGGVVRDSVARRVQMKRAGKVKYRKLGQTVTLQTEKEDFEDEQFEESGVPVKPPWRSIVLADAALAFL